MHDSKHFKRLPLSYIYLLLHCVFAKAVLELANALSISIYNRRQRQRYSYCQRPASSLQQTATNLAHLNSQCCDTPPTPVRSCHFRVQTSQDSQSISRFMPSDPEPKHRGGQCSKVGIRLHVLSQQDSHTRARTPCSFSFHSREGVLWLIGHLTYRVPFRDSDLTHILANAVYKANKNGSRSSSAA